MNLTTFNQLLKDNDIVLAYFSGTHCNVCKALYPKIEQMLYKYPKIKLIKLLQEDSNEIFGQNQILSIPTLIIYFEGKEFIKRVRNFSVEELQNNIDRPYSLYFGE